MERGARLRRRVWALGPRGPGSRVPEALRRDIIDYARERQRQGLGFHRIARETGVTHETIRSWLRAAPSGRDLVPVAVVPEVVAHDSIAVVSPRGYRVEGLDLESAAALLRMLD